MQAAFELTSRGDTRRLGRAIAHCVAEGDLLIFEGDLGAGKTFLVRSIARGLGVPSDVPITSPTFELVHELPARVPLVHVDLYRLESSSAVQELGLDEHIGRKSVVIVEWGERYFPTLGGEGIVLALSLDPSAENSSVRHCQITGHGPRGLALVDRLEQRIARAFPTQLRKSVAR
jgi:tRNA threonylcarbamoyladenosine biosynthesis protein TsaE